MFRSIANLVVRRGWLIVVAWVALGYGLHQAAPTWESVSRDDDVRFFPAGYPSVVGQDLVERGFPHDTASSSVIFVYERRDGKLSKDDLAYIDQESLALLKFAEDDAHLGLKKIETHRTPVIGNRLIGDAADGPGQAALTIALLNSTYQSKAARLAVNKIEGFLKTRPAPPEGLTPALSGSAVVGHDLNTASGESIAKTTYATIGLVVVILLVVYRSPLLALTPLLTIALSVWASLRAIALLATVPNLQFQVINITHVFVVVVLFGAGTDYCLFLIARYREELTRGRRRDAALREAITQVGGALVASAGTVIVGLGMLWFSTFAKIRYTGPAIALSLAISLLASLTLAPVLLHWLRGAVFWPFRQPHHVAGHDVEHETVEQMPMSGFWFAAANLVVTRPGMILFLCLLAMVPPAVIGAKTHPNYSQLADLGPDQTSIVGTKVIAKYFPVGEQGPTSVIVEHPGLDFRTEAGREAIAAVSRKLAAQPNVAEVRSVSQPFGKTPKPAAEKTFLQRQLDAVMRGPIDARYVSTRAKDEADRGHLTRLDVVFRSDPFSDQSVDSLEKLNAALKEEAADGRPLAGAKAFGVTGPTAMIEDLKRVTTQDERRMYWLVTGGVYLILVVLIRRPFICLYLIATVVLGYLASLGLTELAFKYMHTGPEPWGGLDWKVGFFLFVILVAIGEDYNIFLMSRVIEEEAKHGVVEGTRLAVAHTGGIISSCGLIMAGTFGSMLTGSLTTLRELGFALGLGVLLDTFLVRPILVPAFVVLVDRHFPRHPHASHLIEVSRAAANGEADPKAAALAARDIARLPHPHGPSFLFRR